MTRQRPVLSLLAALLLVLGSQAGRAQTSSTSTAENPSFTFSTPGQKQVTLQACNTTGCTQVTQSLTVYDPAPAILTAQVGVQTVQAGQLVTLAGTGRGLPPLDYTWRVTSLTVPEIDIIGAGPTGWDTTGAAPGTYSISLHLHNSAGVADSTPVPVVVTAATGGGFFTITPCRILDTRTSVAVGSGTERVFPVAGLSAFACNIPGTAKAVTANVTIVNPTGSGYLSAFPGNYPVPATSLVNFAAGQTRTNNAILPLASDGSGTLAVYPSVAGGNANVQVVVDVNGYFQ